MIHRTDHPGHREAAGIVVGLFKDWSQFYKEFQLQFYGANRPDAKVSVVAPGPRAPRPGSPLTTTPRPGKRRPWCGLGRIDTRGPPEWDTGDRHGTSTSGAAARGGRGGAAGF